MSNIVLFPTVVARRAWLRREAVKISAGVHGASKSNIERAIRVSHKSLGSCGPNAEADIARALEYVDRVKRAVDQIDRGRPSRRPNDGAA